MLVFYWVWLGALIRSSTLLLLLLDAYSSLLLISAYMHDVLHWLPASQCIHYRVVVLELLCLSGNIFLVVPHHTYVSCIFVFLTCWPVEVFALWLEGCFWFGEPTPPLDRTGPFRMWGAPLAMDAHLCTFSHFVLWLSFTTIVLPITIFTIFTYTL